MASALWDEVVDYLSRVCRYLAAQCGRDTSRPVCSRCLADDVICFGTPRSAICPACCDKLEKKEEGDTGHVFKREPYEGYMCLYCGERASEEWLRDRFDDQPGF